MEIIENFDRSTAGIYAGSIVVFLSIFVPLAFQLPKNLLERFHQLKQEIIKLISDDDKKLLEGYHSKIKHFFYATDILITCGVIHTLTALVNIGFLLLSKTICPQNIEVWVKLFLFMYLILVVAFLFYSALFRKQEWRGVIIFAGTVATITILIIFFLFKFFHSDWNVFVFLEFIVSCVYLVSWFIPGILFGPLSTLEEAQRLVLEIKLRET